MVRLNKKPHFEYKGYRGSIEIDLDDMCLFGKVLGIDSCIMYSDTTLAGLKEQFGNAVDEYIDDLTTTFGDIK